VLTTFPSTAIRLRRIIKSHRGRAFIRQGIEALPEGYTLSLSKGLGVGSIFLCEMLSTEKNNRANPCGAVGGQCQTKKCFKVLILDTDSASHSTRITLYALNGGQLEPVDDAAIQTCTGYKGHFYESE